LTAPRPPAHHRRWWRPRLGDRWCARRDSRDASHPAARPRRPRPSL